ncbi:CAP domain-containing protein [Lederbergia citrea]|uniref:CAP domain-containing protein n=1 Tax=Lederbergia citrea TaxID=2833581 RepID=UPI001BC9DC42|nr:CAP domain-containing protein [Lederbergia citrea]MBS4176661.1 sporulation protein [Lederbergia citrea]MBS4203222.1 sporulation protein [Lederbergia citrea]
MKKLVITTAAAVALMATPFVGKADAAQVQPIDTKVVYKYVNFSDSNDWCNQVFKTYKFDWNNNNNFDWNKKDYKYNKAPEAQKAEPQKPVQQPVQKPVQKPTPEQKPAEPVQQPQQPVQKQEKPAASQETSQLSAFEQQVFELTNQERTKNGLAPLKLDVELSKVAREKSRDMSVNKYFDHNSPTYGSPFDMMKKFGITYRSAGENIAMGQRTPQEVVNAWMNSEGHRANILSSSFTHIGIGHVENGNYWTQQFIGK